jgi:hypothetical protein
VATSSSSSSSSGAWSDRPCASTGYGSIRKDRSDAAVVASAKTWSSWLVRGFVEPYQVLPSWPSASSESSAQHARAARSKNSAPAGSGTPAASTQRAVFQSPARRNRRPSTSSRKPANATSFQGTRGRGRPPGDAPARMGPRTLGGPHASVPLLGLVELRVVPPAARGGPEVPGEDLHALILGDRRDRLTVTQSSPQLQRLTRAGTTSRGLASRDFRTRTRACRPRSRNPSARRSEPDTSPRRWCQARTGRSCGRVICPDSRRDRSDGPASALAAGPHFLEISRFSNKRF